MRLADATAQSAGESPQSSFYLAAELTVSKGENGVDVAATKPFSLWQSKPHAVVAQLDRAAVF